MATKLQIQLQHDDDGFLVGKKRIKTLENTVAATHKNSEVILSHIKTQKTGQRMVFSGRLRLDGGSQAKQTPSPAQRKPIVHSSRPHLNSTSSGAQQIGNANAAHPLANQGERQKQKQLTRAQRRYQDAQARSNHRQELMLKEINKSLKINQGGLLAGLKKLLPLLSMLSAGGGLLRDMAKLPAVVANGGKKADPKNKKDDQDKKDKVKVAAPPIVSTGGKTPPTTTAPPKKKKINLPSKAPKNPNAPKLWDKVKSGGKLLGKGGLLAGAVVLLQGIGVEGSDLERHEKNKEHAKNATVAGSGVAGALAGGAAGAAIGSAFPVVGTAIGGVVGAIIGGIGGSTLADYFVERLDKAIDPKLSRTMFSSWKGFMSVMRYGANSLWRYLLPEKFRAFFEKLGIDTTSMLSTIEGIANVTWDAIGIAGKALWKTVMPEKAQAFFDSLSKEGKAAFEAFKKGFKDLFDAIAESTIGQKIGDGWDYVKGKASDAWEKTKEIVGVGGNQNMYSMDAGAEVPKRQNMGSMDAGVEVPKANQQENLGGKKIEFADLKISAKQETFNGKKVIEAIGGGETMQGTKQLAGALQSRFGQNIKHFSAFNDVYHKKKSPRSLHTKGLAMDFVLQDDKGRVLSWDEGYRLDQQKNIRGQITAEIKSSGLADKDFKILDYSPKQRHGTGPHYHIQFNSKDAAGVYAAHSLGQTSVSRSVSSAPNKSSQSNQAGMNTGTLHLSDQDIENLIKVTETEVVKFKDQATFEAQARGVMDTMINRLESGVWGNTMSDVANAKNQFTKINGPKGYYANGKWVANNPYGSVEKMPSSAVSPRLRTFAMQHLKERENGRPSSVGSHLNYANPRMSDEKNKKAWVNDMEASARKEGMVLGQVTVFMFMAPPKICNVIDQVRLE